MAMLSFGGIDVSKDRLDVMIMPEERSSSVRNNASGWAKLVEQLRGSSIAAIGIEASGAQHVFSTLPVGIIKHCITKAGARPWIILKCSESFGSAKALRSERANVFSVTAATEEGYVPRSTGHRSLSKAKNGLPPKYCCAATAVAEKPHSFLN
jgi:hypothetical protein